MEVERIMKYEKPMMSISMFESENVATTGSTIGEPTNFSNAQDEMNGLVRDAQSSGSQVAAFTITV